MKPVRTRIPETRAQIGSRVFHLGILVFLGFSGLIGALSWHQLINAEAYHRKEAGQTYRRILKEGARGSIFDRNGNLLAGNQPRFWAGVFLNELRTEFRKRYREFQRNPEALRGEGADTSLTWAARFSVLREKSAFLSKIIGREITLDEEGIRNHFARRLILPLELCTDLNRDEYARLVEQLPPESPIQIFSEPVRFYPFGSAACHSIGYVSQGDIEEVDLGSDEYDGIRAFGIKRRTGKSGVELSMDNHLRGGIGWDIWRVDPLGFQFEKVSSKDASQGNDLKTTLDIHLQMYGEALLKGKKGALAALLVETGEVIALVSQPGYDLNDFSPMLKQSTFDAIDAEGGWLHRAVQGLYPPASTFKVITALAALQIPEYQPQKEIYCGPSFTLADRRFRENRAQGHGYVNLTKGLAVSSNVYFYKLGFETGIDRIAAQARLMGLGSPTGIELPYEARNSIVPDPEWKRSIGRGGWLHGETINVAIGQGDLTVTPLQMAAVAASIAGKRNRTPLTIIHGNNPPIQAPSQDDSSTRHFELVIEGMRRCVESGTGSVMRTEGVPIAAKTGTAQVFPGGVEKNLAWVIAFAPADKPTIALSVLIEDTQSDDPVYGGRTTGPIAKAFILEYLKRFALGDTQPQ